MKFSNMKLEELEELDDNKKLKKVDDADGADRIKSEDNIIWFYSEIDTKTSLKLIHKLKEKEKNHLIFGITYDVAPPPIKLYIHSPGGLVTSSFSLANYIKNMKVPVHTIIDNYACSGATVLSVSGAKRFARKNSYIMIHQLNGVMWGSFEEMKDDYKNVKLMMDDIINHYVEHSKIEEKKLRKMLKHDLYFSAEKCLELGLIDEII